MKTILVVFIKEWIDTLRDRRTMMSMVVIPLLMFPLLIGVSSKVMTKKSREAKTRDLTIAIVTHDNADALRRMLRSRDDVRLTEGLTIDEGRALISGDSLTALIVVDGNFDARVAELKPGSVTLYFKSGGNRRIERRRVEAILDDFEEELLGNRFVALDLDTAIMETLEVNRRDLATSKERVADAIGGFLPYLIILFCFTGSMYAAIDLAAGEKERGTLETLFTSPANRLSILIGKFGVVVLTGLFAAAMSLLGMYLGIRLDSDIPPELYDMVVTVLEFDTIAVMISLLIPLTIFFAAVLLSVSIFAKSFKEAQSMIQPMSMMVVVPAFLGMIPGMVLTPVTAFVPILNVSLATKEILAGTIAPALLVEVYVSLIVIAVLGLIGCSKMFENESTVFRGI